jgi:NAD(P)H-dependent FMN reductase
MPKLLVIIASTRPERLGLTIGRWAAETARAHGGFEVEVADLADVALPFFDEPLQPRTGQYTQPHTLAWSKTVDAADAFLVVTPEYNYGPPPSLLNAFDFLYWEWAYKPVGFVSYGGPGAGLRGVQVLKGIVTTMKMMPIPDGVGIPMIHKQIEDGEFVAQPPQEAMLPFHLDEVLRWSEALKPLRAQVPELRTQRPPGAPPLPPR